MLETRVTPATFAKSSGRFPFPRLRRRVRKIRRGREREREYKPNWENYTIENPSWEIHIPGEREDNLYPIVREKQTDGEKPLVGLECSDLLRSYLETESRQFGRTDNRILRRTTIYPGTWTMAELMAGVRNSSRGRWSEEADACRRN